MNFLSEEGGLCEKAQILPSFAKKKRAMAVPAMMVVFRETFCGFDHDSSVCFETSGAAL